MSTMTLSRENFSKVLEILKAVSDSNCTDCDIKSGKIRQKTNDRACVFSADVTTILSEMSIAFSSVKQKYFLFKSFELDDNVSLKEENITIEMDEGSYIFSDELSKLLFRKPTSNLLDNPYIEDTAFNSGIASKLIDDNLVFSLNINQYLCRRIRSICEGCATDTVRCDLLGTTAVLNASTANNETAMKLASEITLNKEFPKGNFRMAILPFILDIKSDIKLDVFKASADVFLCKFNLTCSGIPITIFTQAKVIFE